MLTIALGAAEISRNSAIVSTVQADQPGDRDREIELTDDRLGRCKTPGTRPRGRDVSITHGRQRHEAEVGERRARIVVGAPISQTGCALLMP
jgi:hypothetical protein